MSNEKDDKFESIQNIAIKLVEEQIKLLQIENGPKELTIFILGSKGVGKSGIINKFFEREENSRPTLALEYSFGRRTTTPTSTTANNQRTMFKQILNVWELGSLDNSKQLIDVPLRSNDLNNFSSILILDLSQPNRLWTDFECALNGLKNAYIKYTNDSDKNQLRKKSENRINFNGDQFGSFDEEKKHPDIETLDIFPFPLVIVGGKYDIFQDFDPEIKKHVCRFMRSISHALGASVLFYSNKFNNLSKIMRDTINHLGFGSPTNPFRQTMIDYNGPLLIWFGLDSWEKIGVTPTNSERIGITFNNQIPQIKINQNHNENDDKISLPDDPANDLGFRESLIDEMRSQKDEELMTLLRDTEIRAKFESIKT